MATGKVKMFNEERGFGFIEPDAGGRDVFVHVTDLRKGGVAEVKQGDRLSYDLGDDSSGKGPRATQIQLVPSRAS